MLMCTLMCCAAQVDAGSGDKPAGAVRLGHQRPPGRDGAVRPARTGGAGAPGQTLLRPLRAQGRREEVLVPQTQVLLY